MQCNFIRKSSEYFLDLGTLEVEEGMMLVKEQSLERTGIATDSS
jgi:hypothetical protein